MRQKHDHQQRTDAEAELFGRQERGQQNENADKEREIQLGDEIRPEPRFRPEVGEPEVKEQGVKRALQRFRAPIRENRDHDEAT